MEILAYILSLSGLVCMIAASLVKGEKMKQILFLAFWGNLLVAVSYLIDGKGINGAASLFVGTAMVLCNYCFDSNNKPVPKWLLGIYALAFITVNLWVGGLAPLSLLVTVASLSYIICIGQADGAKYRFWTIVNMILWCLYDVLSGVYSGLLTHVTLLVFTVIGMIIHDKKK